MASLLGFAMQILAMAVVISVVLLFLGVGVLVLVHVCIVGRSIGRSFDANNGRRERSNKAATGLSADDLEKLPCYEFAQKDDECSSSVECVVCLESFRAGDKCRLLPECKHSFHVECVDSWLKKAPIIPATINLLIISSIKPNPSRESKGFAACNTCC